MSVTLKIEATGAHNICVDSDGNRVYGRHKVVRSRPYKYLMSVHITDNKNERAKQLGHYRYLKASIRRKVLERDKHTCQLCGKRGNIVDHIIPWRLSHDNSLENLRVLCGKCNTLTRLKRRDARLPFDEWINEIEKELKSYDINHNNKIRLRKTAVGHFLGTYSGLFVL